MVNKISKLLLLPLCAAAVLGAAVGCGETTSSSSSGDEFDVNSNPVRENFDMWIVGSNWANWTPADVGDKEQFTRLDNGTYKYTVTITDDTQWWGFKFISGKAWTTQFGLEDVDYDKCNDAFKALVKTATVSEDDADGITTYEEYKAKYKEGTSNRSNVSFCQTKDASDAYTHAGEGTYEIIYNPANFESIEENSTTYSHKFVINFTQAK